MIILLNLFRDQLDRYGEVDAIAEKWQESLAGLAPNSTVILNGDDPLLAFLGMRIAPKTRVLYFGIGDRTYYLKSIQHAADTIYCPSCGGKLKFSGIYYSHLGEWRCPGCHTAKPSNAMTSKAVTSPLEGVYNIYNTLASTLALKNLGISKKEIERNLSLFTPAFGRQEECIVDNKKIKILLSKNPTGLNESLRTVMQSSSKGPILMVLNDRIPDGTDVSWIWDADMEQLSGYGNPIIVSGDRCLDLAVRMKYARIREKVKGKSKKLIIKKNLKEAIMEGINRTKKNETFWILPTYSGMLEVRKILIGRKIL